MKNKKIKDIIDTHCNKITIDYDHPHVKKEEQYCTEDPQALIKEVLDEIVLRMDYTFVEMVTPDEKALKYYKKGCDTMRESWRKCIFDTYNELHENNT